MIRTAAITARNSASARIGPIKQCLSRRKCALFSPAQSTSQISPRRQYGNHPVRRQAKMAIHLLSPPRRKPIVSDPRSAKQPSYRCRLGKRPAFSFPLFSVLNSLCFPRHSHPTYRSRTVRQANRCFYLRKVNPRFFRQPLARAPDIRICAHRIFFLSKPVINLRRERGFAQRHTEFAYLLLIYPEFRHHGSVGMHTEIPLVSLNTAALSVSAAPPQMALES